MKLTDLQRKVLWAIVAGAVTMDSTPQYFHPSRWFKKYLIGQRDVTKICRVLRVKGCIKLSNTGWELTDFGRSLL